MKIVGNCVGLGSQPCAQFGSCELCRIFCVRLAPKGKLTKGDWPTRRSTERIAAGWHHEKRRSDQKQLPCHRIVKGIVPLATSFWSCCRSAFLVLPEDASKRRLANHRLRRAPSCKGGTPQLHSFIAVILVSLMFQSSRGHDAPLSCRRG